MQDLDTDIIAEKIENGEFFQESRRWYSEIYHTPIAQRSYYIGIILLATLNVYFSVISFMGVFPINRTVPFVTYANDIVEEIPRIRPLSMRKSEDKNIAVMKFLISSYVENRESYDLPSFELRFHNIWSQSTPTVFEEYKKQIDASNPYSFYRLYTNRAIRDVDIDSVDYEQAGLNLGLAHVVFEASVLSLATKQELGHSKWRADFTYKYTDFEIDQSLDGNNAVAAFFGLTGGPVRASGEKRKVVPMTFTVSDYRVKELLE